MSEAVREEKATGKPCLTVVQQKALGWFHGTLSKQDPPRKQTVTKLFELGLITSAIGHTGKLTPHGDQTAQMYGFGVAKLTPEVGWK